MRKAAYILVKKLQQHGHKAYLCGGCVRDQLLGIPPKDYDIVSSAPASEVKKIFRHTIEVGVQFGVVRVKKNRHIFEVATFRKDGEYRDGRHPENVEFADEISDAQRRDFTINGIFFDIINDKVIDYVSGQQDLQNRVIRTIGTPQERFQEDYLRLIRAIRFACQLDFHIEEQTWYSVQQLSYLVAHVSPERNAQELNKMLTGNDPQRAVTLLRESQTLFLLIPELQNISQGDWQLILQMLEQGKPFDDFTLALATLCYPVPLEKIETICHRLKFSNKVTNKTVNLLYYQSHFERAPQMSLAELKKFLRIPDFHDHLNLYRIYSLASGKNLRIYEFCRKKWQQLQGRLSPPPLLTGKDLIQLGLHPGPTFKEILAKIENEQLNENLTNKQQAIELVQQQYAPKLLNGKGMKVERAKK